MDTSRRSARIAARRAATQGEEPQLLASPALRSSCSEPQSDAKRRAAEPSVALVIKFALATRMLVWLLAAFAFNVIPSYDASLRILLPNTSPASSADRILQASLGMFGHWDGTTHTQTHPTHTL